MTRRGRDESRADIEAKNKAKGEMLLALNELRIQQDQDITGDRPQVITGAQADGTTTTLQEQLIPLVAMVRQPVLMMRVKIDEVTVNKYAAAMQAGAVFPPIDLMKVDGRLLLTGGFHRTAAAELNGSAAILAHVRPGTMEQAILAAARADAHDGLKRTNKDKRKAVEALLATEWGKANSDGVIAEAAGVSQPFVSKRRRSTQNGSELKSTRQGKDGKSRSTKSQSEAYKAQYAAEKAEEESSKAEDTEVPVVTESASGNELPESGEVITGDDDRGRDDHGHDDDHERDGDHDQEEKNHPTLDATGERNQTDGAGKPDDDAGDVNVQDEDVPHRALDPQDFLNAPPEERAAFVQLIGLGAFIDTLPENKLDKPKPLNNEHFRRMCRLIVGALRFVQANDASNAVDALRGVLRVLSSQGRNVDDLAFALRATLKTKKASRSISSTFKNARSANAA